MSKVITYEDIGGHSYMVTRVDGVITAQEGRDAPPIRVTKLTPGDIAVLKTIVETDPASITQLDRDKMLIGIVKKLIF